MAWLWTHCVNKTAWHSDFKPFCSCSQLTLLWIRTTAKDQKYKCKSKANIEQEQTLKERRDSIGMTERQKYVRLLRPGWWEMRRKTEKRVKRCSTAGWRLYILTNWLFSNVSGSLFLQLVTTHSWNQEFDVFHEIYDYQVLGLNIISLSLFFISTIQWEKLHYPEDILNPYWIKSAVIFDLGQFFSFLTSSFVISLFSLLSVCLLSVQRSHCTIATALWKTSTEYGNHTHTLIHTHKNILNCI